MLSFFSKKQLLLKDLPSEWSVSEGKTPDGMSIMRLLQNLDTVTEKEEFPIRIGVAVPFGELDEKTTDLLNKIEAKLVELIDKKSAGRLYAIMTDLGSNSFREFVAQVREDINFKKLHEDLKKVAPKLQVQMIANEDRKWEMYKQIKSGRM